jgi:hypothetical protein
MGSARTITLALAPPLKQKVYQTTDGVNWTSVSPALANNATITFIAIGPSSSFKTYYVGFAGSATGIQMTSNAGGAWTNSNTVFPANLQPNGAAVDYTDSTRAFAAFGGSAGGKVYITTNGGADWTELAGSGANALPNTPITGVAIDPNDPNTIYVVSDIGIFRGTITPPTASWVPFDEGLPDNMDINDIAINRTTGILSIGTMGHGVYERDIRPGITCRTAMLVVRDNVFDRGGNPSPFGVGNPENPIPDPARPNFYKPDDTSADQLYWWTSNDIRIDVPADDPAANQIAQADHVEMETCPRWT